MDDHDPSSYVFGNLREVFQQVDSDILKLIACEHSDDMDAATTAVFEDIEYYQLRLIFPMVDVDILKAFYSEYRNNLETAIKIILDEVVYYMPGFHGNNHHHYQSLQLPNHDHDVALLINGLRTQLIHMKQTSTTVLTLDASTQEEICG